MARTPSYVRLADRLCLGMQVDIESGWGISGFDVRAFPDEEESPVAFEWAKRQLQLGNLEEAGKAEWDEVHESDVSGTDGVERVILVDHDKGIPENKLRESLRSTGQTLQRRRQLRADEAMDDQLDELEDEATDEDDDYVDVTRATGGRAGDAQGVTPLERRQAQRKAGEVKSTGKKKGKKKSGSKSKAAAEDDGGDDS